MKLLNDFAINKGGHRSIAPLLAKLLFLSNDVMDHYFLFTGNGPSNVSYFFE